MTPYRLFAIVIKACLFALLATLSIRVFPAQASISALGSCQCTDYVYSQRPDIARGMGNARDWITSASNRRYPYDQVPEVGDVAVFLNGSHGFSVEFGHVAMVTWVSNDHTRYNIAGWDGLKADCVLQSYSNLTVKPDDWFIHRVNGNTSIPPPSQTSSTGEIEFSPVSPVQAGQTVQVTAKIQAGTNFRAARLLIDYQVVGESSATQFSYAWNTIGFLPSVHNIRLEIASKDDANWVHPYYYETTYLLREAAPQPNQSPSTPSPLSPSDGQVLSVSPQLCWKNNGDPDNDPVKTRAEVWGTQSWTGPWLDGDTPCWTPTGLPNGEYSWAVRARDNKGAESSASSAWMFKLQATLEATTLPSFNTTLMGIWEGSVTNATYNGRTGQTFYSSSKDRFEITNSCTQASLCLNWLTPVQTYNPKKAFSPYTLTSENPTTFPDGSPRIPPAHFPKLDVTTNNPTCFTDQVEHNLLCFSLIDTNTVKLVASGPVGWVEVGTLHRVGSAPSNSNNSADLTDPTSVLAAITSGLRNRDVSIFDSLITSDTKIAAYGGQGIDPKGRWSCPTEGIEPYCYLSPTDFLSELTAHLNGTISCEYWYSSTNGLLDLELKGWNPSWTWPNGESDTLQLDLQRRDDNNSKSPFEISLINVEPMVGPGFYDTTCP